MTHKKKVTKKSTITKCSTNNQLRFTMQVTKNLSLHIQHSDTDFSSFYHIIIFCKNYYVLCYYSL